MIKVSMIREMSPRLRLHRLSLSSACWLSVIVSFAMRLDCCSILFKRGVES